MSKDLLDELRAFPRGAAIFDLDGTLLEGDIADATVERLFEMGHLPDGVAHVLGRDDPWGAYNAFVAQDWCGATALVARMLEGLTVAEVEEVAERAFAEGAIRPKVSVSKLASAVESLHDVWILTASPEALGRVAARHLGLTRVVGYGTELVNGRYTSKITLNTCGPAKVGSARSLIAEHPVFAIGDSMSDLPLLRVARVARTTGKIAGVEFPAFP